MRKRDVLKKFGFLINLLLKIAGLLPKKVHKFVLRHTRHWDCYSGMLLRYIALKSICESCGENVAIFPNVFLINPENLSLGNNVSIHPMCYIDATGKVVINDDVSVAHSTTIMSTEHNYDNIRMNIKDQGCREETTFIDSNVWIGAGVRILAGAKINKGSIIAAGAVVKNEVPENTIVGGIPARKLKERV